MIPTKWSNTQQKQPWITRQIKQLTHRKQRAYKHARLTNNQRDWSTYQDLKRLSQRECRFAFNRYVSSFIDENNNVTKKLWSFIKNKKNKTALELMHLTIVEQPTLNPCLKLIFWLNISHQFSPKKILALYQS